MWIGPSSKGVLNVPHNEHKLLPRTIPKLLSTTSLTLFCLKEHKTRPSVPELNFVSESNKGNLQAETMTRLWLSLNSF
jgi:hypothetical protein